MSATGGKKTLPGNMAVLVTAQRPELQKFEPVVEIAAGEGGRGG
ncbi:hypothetical protein [Phenylobacterium sp.]|jgi:hypothetical protein